MRMDTLRAYGRMRNPHYDVILGLCPGCYAWQVDYTDLVVWSYCQGDLTKWHLIIEEVLTEHMYDCEHLQMALENSL